MAPIHDASETGDLAKVKRLVEEESANPEEPDPSWHNATPLHYAVLPRKDNVVTYLLETYGVDADQADNDNWTALYFASKKNHTSCLRLLLQHGADPNIASTFNSTNPLMIAAELGHFAAMTVLLQDGHCNLEAKRHTTGATAILLAAHQKKWKCLELLLYHNASPIATTNAGISLHEEGM